LASPAPKPKYNHVRTIEDCDNYYNTVLAALALINVLRWKEPERELDPGAKFGVGRRMTTSDKNTVSATTDITPDVVLQCNGKGFVGEITNSLTENNDYWTEKLQQVRKYDDSMLGWWTKDEALPSHDVALLVPQSRAVRVGDILAKGKKSKKGTLKFKRPTALIGFHRHSGASKEFVNLMKFFGDLSDADLSERLRHGIPVPQDILVKVYGDRKFVDSEPPMAYVLQLMWDNVFPSYLSEFPVDAANKGRILLTVKVQKISEDMQNNYGFKVEDARGTEVPARVWIKKALEHLVIFGMAARVDEKTYQVQYRTVRGDHLEYFGGLIFKNKSRLELSAAPLQPMLPGIGASLPPPAPPALAATPSVPVTDAPREPPTT
jgi:hypothetical protein